jgi:signal transduction histidine kinase
MVLVMAIATVAFAWWASGWIVAPLSEFALASEHPGMDVNAPPLAEDGPKKCARRREPSTRCRAASESFVEDRLRMLAAISHDLRGPITRPRLRIEQIDVEADAQRKMLADLDEMAQMVDSSLAFARDEATDEVNQPVDLAALLNTLCDVAVDAGPQG